MVVGGSVDGASVLPCVDSGVDGVVVVVVVVVVVGGGCPTHTRFGVWSYIQSLI